MVSECVNIFDKQENFIVLHVGIAAFRLQIIKAVRGAKKVNDTFCIL